MALCFYALCAFLPSVPGRARHADPIIINQNVAGEPYVDTWYGFTYDKTDNRTRAPDRHAGRGRDNRDIAYVR